MNDKPPLGIAPRDIAEHGFNVFRMGEILGAMSRYSEAQKPIPIEWVNELSERIDNYMNADKISRDIADGLGRVMPEEEYES